MTWGQRHCSIWIHYSSRTICRSHSSLRVYLKSLLFYQRQVIKDFASDRFRGAVSGPSTCLCIETKLDSAVMLMLIHCDVRPVMYCVLRCHRGWTCTACCPALSRKVSTLTWYLLSCPVCCSLWSRHRMLSTHATFCLNSFLSFGFKTPYRSDYYIEISCQFDWSPVKDLSWR